MGIMFIIVFVLLFGFAGTKMKFFRSFQIMLSIALATYLALWLMPLAPVVLKSVPQEYNMYVCVGFCVVAWIVLFALLKFAFDKVDERYPEIGANLAFNELDWLSKALGGACGAGAGYALAGFIMIAVALTPQAHQYASYYAQLALKDGSCAVVNVSRYIDYFAINKDETAKERQGFLEAIVEVIKPEPPKPAEKTAQKAPGQPGTAPAAPGAAQPSAGTNSVSAAPNAAQGSWQRAKEAQKKLHEEQMKQLHSMGGKK